MRISDVDIKKHSYITHGSVYFFGRIQLDLWFLLTRSSRVRVSAGMRLDRECGGRGAEVVVDVGILCIGLDRSKKGRVP
jgi:hypothetical protein